MSVPGLLNSSSSYVVSTSAAPPAEVLSNQGDDGERERYRGRCPRYLSSTATASAFRLLGSLAGADTPRRRIMELDGVVLAASRVVAASAVALMSPPPSPTSAARAPSNIGTVADPGATAEAAAALLNHLAPVLGTHGDEAQLIAAGEALSAAVVAVSTRCDHACAGSDRPSTSGSRASGGGGVECYRGLDLGVEALSALLVLAWSDASSLEAAAAVDGVVTDAGLVKSVVSLWRRGMAAADGAVASAPRTAAGAAGGAVPCSGYGTVTSVALTFLSSVVHRPAGRPALIAAGADSAMVQVALQPRRRTGGAGDTFPVSDRGEVIRLLCVLCASPAHRAAVRESLAACVTKRERDSGGGGGGGKRSVGVEPDAESVATVESAIVRLQGGSGGGGGQGWQGCRSDAIRLALLLGVSPPPPPSAPVLPNRRHEGVSSPRGTARAGVAGQHPAATVTPSGGAPGVARSPPIVTKRRSASATNSPSPPPAYSAPAASVVPPPERGDRAARDEGRASSMYDEELEEALYPTAVATTSGSSSRFVQERVVAIPQASSVAEVSPAIFLT